MTLHIREAQAPDAPAMARVFVDSFVHAHRGHVSEADLASRSYARSEASWLRGMREIAEARAARAAGLPLSAEQLANAETFFLVAESQPGAILGLAVTGLPHAPHRSNTVPAEWLHDSGEVDMLYVDLPAQRQGVGRALVQAAADHHARAGRSHLLIGVLAANTPARRFYESIGGHLVGTSQFPDEDGSLLDGAVYGWTLTPQHPAPNHPYPIIPP